VPYLKAGNKRAVYENHITTILKIRRPTLLQCDYDYEIKDDVMGVECSTDERDEQYISFSG
jgi:hypothetical protein